MIDDWTNRAYSRWRARWPSAAKWFLPTLTLILAAMLVWPGALMEIADGKEKWWVALISMLVLSAFLFIVGRDAVIEVQTPKRPKVHIFIPANDVKLVGDALLQYAGFLAAKEKFASDLDLRFYDSSSPDWISVLEQCIANTPRHEPIWAIVTMSSKGAQARERLDVLLERDYQLRKQLTILFTVTSSRFETSDRDNYFRVFIDGRQEAVAIASHIRLARSEGSPQKVLCVRNNSNYGKDAAAVLVDRLRDMFTVDVVSVDDLSTVKSAEYQIAVVIAYDEDLRAFFTKLKGDGFRGLVIGTTTLSVPDWQARIEFPENVEVLHTTVDHDDKDFEDRLKPINVDTIAALGNTCLINQHTVQQLRNDTHRYNAYKNISYNYISAFCEDCVRLFAVAARVGKPSIRSLLDDAKYDQQRRKTIIRDVDFGVTGEAHVSVFLKRLYPCPLSGEDAGAGGQRLRHSSAEIEILAQCDGAVARETIQ